MSTAPPAARPKNGTKIETPPAWKWLMRVTGTFAMLLFLTPTFYVVKYYAVDRPREEAVSLPPLWAAERYPAVIPEQADYLPWLEERTRDSLPGNRLAAIHQIGVILRQPGMNWKRPLESLGAKATLADLAAKNSDPAVQAAASEELGKVAQGGAVIRR